MRIILNTRTNDTHLKINRAVLQHKGEAAVIGCILCYCAVEYFCNLAQPNTQHLRELKADIISAPKLRMWTDESYRN